MAKLTYTNPQVVHLKASGYKPAPTGEIDIIENGQYDVTDYASANVNVPEPSGNIDIVSNGEFDVKDYAQATVSVPLPTGSIELTENKRDYDVYNYATARVNVPEPTGTIRITENKTENVKDYEFAEVDVPLPSGEITLDKNNQAYDVTDYTTANVAIPEEEKTVTPSAVQQVVTPDNGLLRKVTVNPTPLEERTVTPTIVQQTITPEAPAIGLSKVTVGAAPPPPTLISKSINSNGTYAAEDDNADGYSDVTVDVPREITKLVDGTITEYVDDEVTAIRRNALSYCTNLTRISLAEATEIGYYSFGNCGTITQINFPKVLTIDSVAFQSTPLIHPVGEPFVFPNVLSIGTECFGRYSTSPPLSVGFYFPKLISMGNDAWRSRYAKVILKQQCALVGYTLSSFSHTVYYVPQRYFNWYTTATNWSAAYSAYPNSIQTIEDNIDYLVSLGYDRAELLKDEEVPT